MMRPKGLLLLSLHGDAYAPGRTPADRSRYAAGEAVVLHPEHAGANLRATLHPPSYVRDHLSAGFAVRTHAPEDALNGAQVHFRDIVVPISDVAGPSGKC